MDINYTGLNAQGQRTYAVDGKVVTAVDEENWVYACSCGFKALDVGDALLVCEHVDLVMQTRAEFEAADDELGRGM